MQAFVVELMNRPGEFARQAEAVAKRGINVYPFGLGIGDRGGAAFIAQDEAGLRSALNDAGIGFREVSLVGARLEDKPGTAAAVARKLADAGVNIELFAAWGMEGSMATVAIGVDKPEEARRALGEQHVELAGSPASATR